VLAQGAEHARPGHEADIGPRRSEATTHKATDAAGAHDENRGARGIIHVSAMLTGF
jgi:hypothetical protein